MPDEIGIYIGEVIDEVIQCRVKVYAELDQKEGKLRLYRKPVDIKPDTDWPYTVVTREGLLRLSQGPIGEVIDFEGGFVEDHL